MSQQPQAKKEQSDAILESSEHGLTSKKEDVVLRTHFESDDNLILDMERMSKQLADQPQEVLHGDKKEGVETVLYSGTHEPRFNVMSTTASGAVDLPDTKMGGDVHHMGESKLQRKFRKDERETLTEPSVLEPGFPGRGDDTRK